VNFIKNREERAFCARTEESCGKPRSSWPVRRTSRMQTDFQPATSAFRHANRSVASYLTFVLFRKTFPAPFLRRLFRVQTLDEQRTILGDMRKHSKHTHTYIYTYILSRFYGVTVDEFCIDNRIYCAFIHTTRNYSAIANSHNLPFTRAHA
jgi:hypothetical protein